jgi:hypothetical protein
MLCCGKPPAKSDRVLIVSSFVERPLLPTPLFFTASGAIAAVIPVDEFPSVPTLEAVTMEVVNLKSKLQFSRQADPLDRYILYRNMNLTRHTKK